MRNSPSRFAVSLVCLVLVVGVAWIGGAAWSRASRRPAAVNTGAGPHLEPVSAKTASAANAALPESDASRVAPKPADLPASTAAGFVYTASAAQPLATVIHRFWPQTQYMTRAELETALRQANNLSKSNYLKAGQQVVIPGYEASPIVEKPVEVHADFEARAVYLTGIMAGSQNGMKIVQHWREAGGNTIVFDVKDSDGSVNIPFDNPLAPKHSPAIPNLPKYVRWLHGQGMHAIARIALFRDENIAQRHSELAIHSRRSGQPWLENGKLVWTDPSNPQVQQYNLALAKTAAAAGVDEIQFDYVRFPAEGDQADAKFSFQGESQPCATGTADALPRQNAATAAGRCHDKTRADVIAGFLQKAYSELHPMHVLVSLDVFGVMAWQRPVDLSHTGQDIVRMVPWCDVLSPMIYPSHFFGMDGYAQPGDAPEHFIGESMLRFQKITTGVASGGGKSGDVVVRPWLQAFAWKTKTYSPEYIRVQVATSKKTGGDGFLFWNARNDYSKPYAAMPEMRANPKQYFRGDELPAAKTASVALAPQRSH